MFFLIDFNVIKPDPGLIFWTAIIFLFVWGFLGKAAFKPIQNALKKREEDIQTALDEAKRAREEISGLKADNEKLLAQAREERANILREAKEAKDQIVKEARDKAKEEAHKIVANAAIEIENQRMAAITDLKNQAGMMALEIAEKLIRKELAGDSANEQFVKTLVSEMKLN